MSEELIACRQRQVDNGELSMKDYKDVCLQIGYE